MQKHTCWSCNCTQKLQFAQMFHSITLCPIQASDQTLTCDGWTDVMQSTAWHLRSYASQTFCLFLHQRGYSGFSLKTVHLEKKQRMGRLFGNHQKSWNLNAMHLNSLHNHHTSVSVIHQPPTHQSDFIKLHVCVCINVCHRLIFLFPGCQESSIYSPYVLRMSQIAQLCM